MVIISQCMEKQLYFGRRKNKLLIHAVTQINLHIMLSKSETYKVHDSIFVMFNKSNQQ
jgi:hypothetical protein